MWGWVDVGLGTFPDKAALTVLSAHLEDYVGALQGCTVLSHSLDTNLHVFR